jgi:hypothetical protein
MEAVCPLARSRGNDSAHFSHFHAFSRAVDDAKVARPSLDGLVPGAESRSGAVEQEEAVRAQVA